MHKTSNHICVSPLQATIWHHQLGSRSGDRLSCAPFHIVGHCTPGEACSDDQFVEVLFFYCFNDNQSFAYFKTGYCASPLERKLRQLRPTCKLRFITRTTLQRLHDRAFVQCSFLSTPSKLSPPELVAAYTPSRGDRKRLPAEPAIGI